MTGRPALAPRQRHDFETSFGPGELQVVAAPYRDRILVTLSPAAAQALAQTLGFADSKGPANADPAVWPHVVVDLLAAAAMCSIWPEPAVAHGYSPTQQEQVR